PVKKEIGRILNTASMNGEVTLSAQREINEALGKDFSYDMLMGALKIFLNDVNNRHMAYATRLHNLQRRSVVGNDPLEAIPINENEKKLQEYMEKFNVSEPEARAEFAKRGVFLP